jgi:hypothetical protein
MKISIDAQIAIRSFAQSLIAGGFGPDDSRDGRSEFFLKYPSIVGQAMAVFLYRLELDQVGQVLNTTKQKIAFTNTSYGSVFRKKSRLCHSVMTNWGLCTWTIRRFLISSRWWLIMLVQSTAIEIR